nr:SIR2 family protein [uncultured Flavobacterium sp.]
MNNKEIINKIAFLKEAILNDKLVVFAGSGVSIESGIPLWKDLLEGIKTKLNFNAENENDALKIAQLLFNEKGEKEYYDIIKSLLFNNSKNRYNPLHELIFQLNPQHIVTTNYDNFFEQYIENEGLPFSLVVKDEDLPYAKHKNLVIKYHGDFENHNIVLKETDYLEFSKTNTLKEIFVKSLFSNKVILFVGYSFSDINLKLLSRDVQYILKKHHQSAYMLDVSDSISESEKMYYKNLGINIINYNQADKEIPNLDSFYDEEQIKISSYSSRAYKLLNYISEFNLDKHKNNLGDVLKDNQVIEELHRTFKKFHYFRILPKNFLSNLYPLNKNAKSSWIIKDSVFICFNHELYNLIQKFQVKGDISFNDIQKDKILYCIERLWYSGVYHIALPELNPDSIGNYGFVQESLINLKTKINLDANCDCLSCNLNKYKYSDIITKIEKYVITNSSDLIDDLNYANTLYKLNYNFKSLFAFQQIYYKSNKQKRFEVSFIAIYNVYWLAKFRNFFYEDYVDEIDYLKVKKIEKNIDLDKELFKVKYLVDEKVYDLLREIRSGIYMQRLCDDINEKYQAIPETKKLIERGGGSSNDDINNLYKSIIKLENYRDLNFINVNGFSRITLAIQKSINAFMVAYSMKFLKNEVEHNFFGTPHMNSYNHFLIKEIIEYADTGKLDSFIRENKLENIEILEESIPEIFSCISNFLDSVTSSNRFSSKPLENSNVVAKLSSDTNFRILVLKQLDNICLVLTYFKLPKDILNELYQKLNIFIKFVKFKGVFDYQYLEKLLLKKHLEIDTEAILNTLQIFYSNNRFDGNYERILDVLNAKDENFTTNLFDVNQFEINNTKWKYHIIYACLEGELKVQFKDKIRSFLISEEADLFMLFRAIYNDVLIEPQIVEKYKSNIHQILISYESQSGKYRNQSANDIINFFKLIYLKKIDLKGFENIEIKDNYFKFLYDPNNFPIDDFNSEWLKIEKCTAFIEIYKEVEYIIPYLENYLTNNEDVDLMKLFFRLKKKTHPMRMGL